VKQTATAEDYARVFEAERQREYPLIDAFERRMGYAIDRVKLEEAARVLACPVKRNPPCWQHGRVLFAVAKKYFRHRSTLGRTSMVEPDMDSVLDIGTAKGFSALCLLWASALDAKVTSLDVIDPHAPVIRNTVAEIHRPITLHETLEPWPEAKHITFVQSTGIDWLKSHHDRLHVVFVDGKHTADVVAKEAALILARQVPGDLCIFDDVHLPEIRAVVRAQSHAYTVEYLDILPNRGYAVGVRK
jgi:predicted O-methyltransferase YrrM